MRFLQKNKENQLTLFHSFVGFLPIVPLYVLLNKTGANLAIYAVGRTPNNKYYDGDGYPFNPDFSVEIHNRKEHKENQHKVRKEQVSFSYFALFA